MALVDNFLGNQQHGSSRLMMIQARFQQRQQEEKEHKLFAMLEEQHDPGSGDVGGGLGLIPATRTHSNGSNNSQHNSASSNASLSSSIGSSLASSLGSTGSGMTVPGGGKVRQMFEERRSQINGRPPVYAKNVETRKAIPVTTRGWDRSHPLDPLPSNAHERNLKVPTGSQQQQRSRARGVSLERGAHAFDDGKSDGIRRSKSQYQVDDAPGGIIRSPKRPPPSDGQHLLNVSGTLKPKSMTSLLDDNQNAINNHPSSKTIPRFGYNQSPVRNPSLRYQQASRDDTLGGSDQDRTDGSRNRSKSQQNDEYRRADRMDDSARLAASQAAAAMAAAAETTRRLEREKAQIQAEAKRREEELMNTIRKQQEQLQLLKQAASLAEQKAKAATAVPAAASVSRSSRPMKNSYRPADESSDDSKSSVSDDAVLSPPSSRGWNPASNIRKSSTSATHETSATPTPVKPKLAPKPVVESSPTKNATMPRKSIFATGPSAGGKDGLIACSLCGRNFASDRIEKHEGICAKTKAKKRKVFDITKMRVKGTEAESFVLAPPGRNNQQNNNSSNKKPISIGQHILQQQQQAAKVTAAPSAKESEDSKKADWRKKHESFIEAIRAAKAMQKHLKAGGKLSDLPPPPPSDTSTKNFLFVILLIKYLNSNNSISQYFILWQILGDYITCPYCQRLENNILK
uniref:Zinc finger C2HC domain-containing protein 1B n=1 Tax=Daphnia magna TaxID=35525 RepID=A0A0P5XF92_9CRUS